MFRRLVFLIITLVCLQNLRAQETTSEINGLVTDGRTPLSGATVVALHQPSGTTYKTTSRKDGRYNLPNLRIGGPYLITITYVGYATRTQDSVNLTLGQEFKADFSLAAESKELSSVTVTGTRQGKVFNSSRTGSQEIITRQQLERLPTITRSLTDYTRLSPTANGLSFGGQSSQYNNLTIDGANFNNSFGLSGTLGGQTNSQPISQDAIEQIQVNTTPFDVRQGGFSGAGINSVTRSGTNQIRGSVYTYLKGPGTQGYHVGKLTVPRQDYSYNLRGANVGGALIKDKLFFFVSFEQERRTDPGTSFVAADASHTPDALTVSNATASSLDSLSAFLKSKYNYDPGTYQNYSYKTQSDKITARLDWNLNANNTITVKYNYLKSSRQVAASNSGSVQSSYGRTPGQYALPFNGSGYTINNNFNIFIAELNTRIGNNATNKLQVGYTALRDFRAAASSSAFPLVDILDGNGNPYTSFGYEQYTYGNLLNTNVFQLNDIYTFYKGSHEITVGTQNSFKKYENGFSPSYEGVYRFASLKDFYASANDASIPAQRYDLSYTLPTPGGSFPLVGPKDIELGFFVQDKWRVTNTFTFTYGLRVDVPIFQNTFKYNDAAYQLTGFYNGVRLNTGKGPDTNPLFGPRIGFNWDVKGKHLTQVRGGAGLFAGPPPFVWISNQSSNSGVALFGSVSNANNIPFSAQVSPNPNWPSTVSNAPSKSYSLNVTDPKFKFPQALKTSLAVDQKLPGDITVTVELGYAKDVNAAFFQNVNLPTDGTPLVGADQRVRYAVNQIYPVGGSANSSVENPSIGNAIYLTNVNKGYSYNATLQVQKTFRNLYVNVAYTYSRSKDVMVGGSTAATMWGSKPISGNPNDAQLGFANGYLPHRIVASAYYKFDYSKYFSTSVGLLFEAAPSGVGSYVYNGDLNNDGQTSNDLMYIPKADDYSSGRYLVESSDSRTPDVVWNQINSYIEQDKYLRKHRGSYAERNAVIYPWFKRLDANVTQDIMLKTGKDRHTLRLSVDIVNVGNLLNKNWGTYRIPSALSGFSNLSSGLPNAYSLSLVKFDKINANGQPIYSFPYQVPATETPYTKTWKDDTSLASRFQLQVGIRYLFN